MGVRLPSSIAPLQKLTKGSAAVAVARLLFGAQFGKRLFDLRKIKQRIVSKSVGAARRIENQPFGGPAKGSESLAIARGGQDAHESSSTLLWRNFSQFPQNTGVVRLVIRVFVGEVRLVGCVARGMHAWGAVECIHFKSGVVSHYDLSRRMPAVFFRFFACVVFEGEAIFDHGGQGSEVGNTGNFNSVRCGSSREVAELSGIRSGDEDSSHKVRTQL